MKLKDVWKIMQSSGLPWISPKKTAGIDLSGLTDSFGVSISASNCINCCLLCLKIECSSWKGSALHLPCICFDFQVDPASCLLTNADVLIGIVMNPNH